MRQSSQMCAIVGLARGILEDSSVRLASEDEFATHFPPTAGRPRSHP
jgi:hypothetical protein